MILKIILFIILFLSIVAILFFLICILSPAVSEQTRIDDNILLSKFEHNFKKIDGQSSSVDANSSEKRAVVLCSCDKHISSSHFMKNTSSQSCAVIAAEYSSLSDCPFMCIGKGDCISSCPQNAILIKNETAVISNLCIGCGNCISACPKGIISMIDKRIEKTVICSNSTTRLTTCDALKKEQIIPHPEKKYFKIFQSCYRILFE